MRVLLISTICTEGAYLHKALRESAHSLQMTDDLRDGLHLASQDNFDAVLIVAVDTESICNLATLLPEFARLPGSPAILVVLGRATPVERARMLRAGADACFVQPYSFIEMQERMLALYRSSVHDPMLDLSLRLDPLTRELVEGDKRFTLTKREFLLVESLLRQPDAPVARDQLIRYAWPDKDVVDPSSVNLVVSRLRRKLELHNFGARLETVSRFGYQISTTHLPPVPAFSVSRPNLENA
ncbi:two-component system OmpR family response regulator [Caballeronia udeis]|uniref:Two-component system OmpR family response regulator n=1 Tax=Caballeronia udeis TaxID=1232866 RepID=A0ABW8MLY5_9BURK